MIQETKDRLTFDAGIALADVVAECRRALTTIATAAGLPADASAEEVEHTNCHQTLRRLAEEAGRD